MERVKKRKLYIYSEKYEYYEFYFVMVAWPILAKDGRQEYQVSVYEADEFYYYHPEPILAPFLHGKTPQIAFSEAKKFVRSICIPDPEFKELCDHHDLYMRRVLYGMNKKKKPYVPSKTKS